MCLAIEGVIVSIQQGSARADFGGIARDVRTDLVPEAKEGDRILVHAGYAIQVIQDHEWFND